MAVKVQSLDAIRIISHRSSSSTMLTGLQAAVTHLAVAVESLLLIGLHMGFPHALSNVVSCKQDDLGLTRLPALALAVYFASKWYLRLDVLWW